MRSRRVRRRSSWRTQGRPRRAGAARAAALGDARAGASRTAGRRSPAEYSGRECDSLAMPLDRAKVWTGDLNARALEPQPRGTIGLYDTTPRDGEQTVGVVLSPEQKVEIATALSMADVDRI